MSQITCEVFQNTISFNPGNIDFSSGISFFEPFKTLILNSTKSINFWQRSMLNRFDNWRYNLSTPHRPLSCDPMHGRQAKPKSLNILSVSILRIDGLGYYRNSCKLHKIHIYLSFILGFNFSAIYTIELLLNQLVCMLRDIYFSRSS